MPITHEFVSAVSDGGDTSLVRPSDWNDPHVGGSVELLLDYTYAGSDLTGATMTGGADYDITGNQNFTVASASSLIEVSVRGLAQSHKNSGGDGLLLVKAIIDSAGSPVVKPLGGQDIYNSLYLNPFTGLSSVYVSGLSAGVHTIKIVLRPDATDDLYLRPSSSPEFLAFQVIEHGS